MGSRLAFSSGRPSARGMTAIRGTAGHAVTAITNGHSCEVAAHAASALHAEIARRRRRRADCQCCVRSSCSEAHVSRRPTRKNRARRQALQEAKTRPGSFRIRAPRSMNWIVIGTSEREQFDRLAGINSRGFAFWNFCVRDITSPLSPLERSGETRVPQRLQKPGTCTHTPQPPKARPTTAANGG